MNPQMLKAYLKRIGLEEAPEADAHGLETLQRAHLRHVPFENLDIIDDKGPLKLDVESLYDKIVIRKRGGICYEQNILFLDVLRTLGFDAELRGAAIRDAPFYDVHACIFVRIPTLDSSVQCWLTDVGFGDNYAKPLLCEIGIEQSDGRDMFRIDESPDRGQGFLTLMIKEDGAFVPLMSFGPEPWAPEDFRERADDFAMSEDSHFRQGPLVCIDTPSQRLTLSGNHFTTTRNGERTTIDITSEEQFDEILRDVFHIAR